MFILSELMEGGSLASAVYEGQGLTPQQRHSIGLDVARGMVYLHSSSVLHRDLTPHNILLDGQYRAKVSDFGLSKHLRHLVSPNAMVAANAAETSAISGAGVDVGEVGSVGPTTGNLLYVAPEVFRGEVLTVAADVYSYGVCLWEMWHVQLPYTNTLAAAGLSVAQLPQLVGSGQAILEVDAEGLGRRADIGDLVGQQLGIILAKCLHHDARQRPTFKHVLTILESLIDK
jgi:serine/threonine protein kinase